MPLVEVTVADQGALAAAAKMLTSSDREAFGASEPARSPAAVADWLTPPTGRERHVYLMTVDAREPVGVATLQLRRGGGNDHLAWVRELFVLPDARGRGHGSRLLDHIVHVARADRRTFLALRHLVEHRAGQSFADAKAARYAMTVEVQRVAVADVAPALLDTWVQRAPERASGYDLVGWRDRCPEEHLARFASAQAIMGDAPHPESTNTWIVSEDEIRAMEATNAHNGTTQWVLAARDRTTGDFAGYTEMIFDPHRSWLAIQGDTGVAAAHRERGIGRWIKAVNLQRLIREKPAVTYVETANAGGNEPMLAINDAIGFRVVAALQDRELWFDER